MAAAARLRDVAELAGVSMKTVSNVVRDQPHVSTQMRERVQKAIDELGYVPNTTARRLATGRTGMAKLAFSDLSAPYFAELASRMVEIAEKHDLKLLIEQTRADADAEKAVLQGRERGLVDGIIFEPSRLTSADIALARGRTPLVLLGEVDAPLSVDHVMIDNIAAAKTATSHLLERGRTRIAFLAYHDSHYNNTVQRRLVGYEGALTDASRSPDPALYIPSAGFEAADADRAVSQALAAGVSFDGLVCYDDLAAIGAMHAVHRAGLTVPGDVAIVGWDDIYLGRYSNPPLTSITPDVESLCTRAVEMLAERIGGYDGIGRHELVDYHLTVRESS